MSHIFVSYSHKDTDYSHKLADYLREQGFEVWIDVRLDYGSTWPQEIQKQLDTCSVFIVVMTPRSYDSEWVQNELNRAKRLGKPIFPVLLEGDGPWLSVEATQFLDVRGGIFPDERFCSTLERIIPRTKDGVSVQPVIQPSPATQTVAATQESKSNLPLFAGIGVLAVIVIGAVLFAGNRSSSSAPITPSALPDTPVPTEIVTVEPTMEIVSPTDTSVPPSETPTSLPPTPTSIPAEITDAMGVEMVLVPAGEFTMGSDLLSNESPVHTVYLDTFYIDKFEVTNAQYQKCVADGSCLAPKENGSQNHTSYYGSSQFADYPVIWVNWNMAKAYCEWRENDIRLPTETEWEKAARGTDARTYPWGDGFDCGYGNFLGCTGDVVSIGSYKSGKSVYGAYDMAGNVWEWVSDWYDERFYASAGAGKDNPQGPAGGNLHVLRGGSFLSGEANIRASYRFYGGTSYTASGVGFRCAMTVSP